MRFGWFHLIGTTGLSIILSSSGCHTHDHGAAPPVLTTSASQPASNQSQVPVLQQATLIAHGNPPFHLKAFIGERGDSSYKGEIEIYWMAPDKWRRTIRARDFSQTLVVNGKDVFEEDLDDYFPLGLQTLATALVDPKPILDAYRPGDRLVTQANNAANESAAQKSPIMLFGGGRSGFIESVGAAGHDVDFMNYQEFNGKKVARRLIYRIDPGDSLSAQVIELEELKNPDPGLFTISRATPKEKQIHAVILQEAEMRHDVVQSSEIIWPQVLDGAVTGTSTYYLSLDRSGVVREAVPVQSANERANDSAVRQLLKWKFKPVMRDGIPVQAESVLTFQINTRAWGPVDLLTDAQVRKLVSNLVEPDFPPGTTSGSTKKLWLAVDNEGDIIEVIAGEGPPELFEPCYDAMKKWHFNPVMEHGQPRPYRAELDCRVP